MSRGFRFLLPGAAALALWGAAAELRELKLPLQPGSVRFAVIGDSGTGQAPEEQVAEEMAAMRARFPFDFVLMLGDNIYGRHQPADFERKFEAPYRPLLDAGVKFYASLGNHDSPNERFYAPFHMDGKRYYSFRRGEAEFFALDSNYMDPEQLRWLERQLHASRASWKICFFHHPLYSNGKSHGPDRDLRAVLEPIFERNGVDVVFSGHEHVYERLAPENGIQYFIMGCSGKLNTHDFRPSPAMARGFDTDRAFLLAEIAGDRFWFQAISRGGGTVDSGVLIHRDTKAAAAP